MQSSGGSCCSGFGCSRRSGSPAPSSHTSLAHGANNCATVPSSATAPHSPTALGSVFFSDYVQPSHPDGRHTSSLSSGSVIPGTVNAADNVSFPAHVSGPTAGSVFPTAAAAQHTTSHDHAAPCGTAPMAKTVGCPHAAAALSRATSFTVHSAGAVVTTAPPQLRTEAHGEVPANQGSDSAAGVEAATAAPAKPRRCRFEEWKARHRAKRAARKRSGYVSVARVVWQLGASIERCLPLSRGRVAWRWKGGVLGLSHLAVAWRCCSQQVQDPNDDGPPADAAVPRPYGRRHRHAAHCDGQSRQPTPRQALAAH